MTKVRNEGVFVVSALAVLSDVCQLLIQINFRSTKRPCSQTYRLLIQMYRKNTKLIYDCF